MESQHLTLTEQQARGLQLMVEALQRDDAWIHAVHAAIADRLPEGIAQEEWSAELLQRRVQGLLGAAQRRDLSGYFRDRHSRYREMAAAGLSLRDITRTLTTLRTPVVDHLRTHIPERSEQMAAVDIFDFVLMESLVSAGEVYAAQRQDDVEDEYRQLVRRLSTPVIEVWDEIQVLPLIGVIDSTRAQQMTEQLLEKVVERQTRVVILDITGVPTVDTAVADHLLKTTRAASLVGARAILVGISPQVAQTLVRLGVSLNGMHTFADLRSGLEHALESLGYAVRQSEA